MNHHTFTQPDDATSCTTDPLDQSWLLNDAPSSKLAIATKSGTGTKNKISKGAGGSLNLVGERPNAAGDSRTELHYIVAPPGTLGLVLKLLSNNRGHAIAQLNADSPLQGKVHAGDRIVSMTVDMHKRSLSEVVALLNKNWNYKRSVTLRKTSSQAVRTIVIPIGQCGFHQQVESDASFLGVPLPRFFLRAPKSLNLSDFALLSMTVHTEVLSRDSLKELLSINWSEERQLAVMRNASPTGKKISAFISKESVRTVIVPAGRLRFKSPDRNVRGPPMIRSINPTPNALNPLIRVEGLLPGDIIFGVDEIDTTKMPPAEVFSILHQRSNQELTLLVWNRNHPRTIMVPPGDLAINFRFEKGSQPLISSTHKGSPVERLLLKGDVVLAIDGVDTRLLTREQVTFALSANKQRALMVQWKSSTPPVAPARRSKP